jgi:hypothetical protein
MRLEDEEAEVDEGSVFREEAAAAAALSCWGFEERKK